VPFLNTANWLTATAPFCTPHHLHTRTTTARVQIGSTKTSTTTLPAGFSTTLATAVRCASIMFGEYSSARGRSAVLQALAWVVRERFAGRDSMFAAAADGEDDDEGSDGASTNDSTAQAESIELDGE
jgi:hypothetical protein